MWSKIAKDKEFTSKLTKIAVPVMLQHLITNGLNTLDTFMITKLGTNSVAGVGLANQAFFFFSFILFGINTGSSILFAQYYGAGEEDRIKKTLGYSMKFSVLVSIIFNFLAFFKPELFIQVFIDDSGVINEGAKYLRLVSFSYILTALSFSIGFAMRSTDNPKAPFVASLFSFFVNAFFNYCFIFGKFGMPRMGVRGAAIGTIIARCIEFLVLIYVLEKYRGPCYDKFANYFKRDVKFRKQFLIVITPVVIEESLWSLAQVVYSGIYAKIGVNATAGIQVAQSVSNLLYVVARGLSSATAVIIGVKIGEGDYDRAQDIAMKSLAVGATFGAILGAILIIFPSELLKLFPDLTYDVRELSRTALMAMGLTYPIRMHNSVGIVGVLRGGGDVKYSMTLETICSWIVGIPLGMIAVGVFHVPLWAAILFTTSDELVKMIVSLPRMRKGLWIKNYS